MPVVPAKHGYAIAHVAPSGLTRAEREAFYAHVVELGLARKDRELAAGLDKDGKPLRPITPETRKYRRSAMTPSGKGDPNAPPLTPAHERSRTRALLTGRAEDDRAYFWWRYDPLTYDSWAVILSYQREQGRDVFGLSKAGVAWVVAHATARIERARHGRPVAAAKVPIVRQAPARVAPAGSFRGVVDWGIGHTPGRAALRRDHGTLTGLRSPERLRQELVAPVRFEPPGRSGVGAFQARLVELVFGAAHRPSAVRPGEE